MGLKSLIEKILIVNKALEHSYTPENLSYKKYLPKGDFKNLEELKKIFNNSKECAQNEELKLGLKIILTLISHKNEDIKASALGKIYFLVDDEYVQEIIVRELKSRSYNRNEDLNGYAQNSLDLIAMDVNKLEVFEIIFKMLTELGYKFKVDKFNFSLILQFYFPKNFLEEVSKIRNKRKIFYPDTLFNSVLRRFRVFNRRIDRMVPYFEEIENAHYDNLIESETISHSHIPELEFNEEDPLQRLARLYAQNFREKGHLRRLIALLDDEDRNIQQMGVNALIYVVKVLLSNSNQEKVIKPLSNSHLDESLEIT